MRWVALGCTMTDKLFTLRSPASPHVASRTQDRPRIRPAVLPADRLRRRPAASRPSPTPTAWNGCSPTAPRCCSPPAAPASSSRWSPRSTADVVKVALDTCRGRTPIVAGAGGGTTLAIKYAQEAERLGAQGILLLPHYLTEGSQDGLVAHIEAVCRSVKIGVIVYNRGGCKLTPGEPAGAGRPLPEPDRLQGRRGRHREVRRRAPDAGRPLRLPGRPAHRGGVRRRVQGDGLPGLLVGRLQLHPEDRDGLLQRAGRRRQRHHATA